MLTTTSLKNISRVETCQVPEVITSGVSLNEAVCLWLYSMRGSKKTTLFHWVHLLRANVHKRKSGKKLPIWVSADVVSPDVDKVAHFNEYRQALSDKLVVVRKLADRTEAKIIRQSDSSRYFPVGRSRVKARIIKRMGGFYSANGLMLSCTYDPKLIGCQTAWVDVGERGRALMNKVNTWRHRQGMSKVRGIKVLEEQTQTGYPHLHIAFPKLRWLAPVAKLTEWWGQSVNAVELTYRDNFSPAGYVCKYVSKLDGWSDNAMAEIWFNRTRLYSMSSDYYLQPLEKRSPEWSFYGTSRCSGLNIPEMMLTFDSVDCDDKGLLMAGFT